MDALADGELRLDEDTAQVLSLVHALLHIRQLDLMTYKGVEACERYIMNDILAIYAAQGHEISSKHLEVIIHQMFSHVIIDEPGDTNFVTGDILSRAVVAAENKRVSEAGKEPAAYTRLLLGISKVAIYSDSFLSAASFQDTTRVLINSAIQGRIDHLKGLKENVIIGRKIPVGTGVTPLVVEENEEDSEFASDPTGNGEPKTEELANV